jgi:hypothetical protein
MMTEQDLFKQFYAPVTDAPAGIPDETTLWKQFQQMYPAGGQPAAGTPSPIAPVAQPVKPAAAPVTLSVAQPAASVKTAVAPVVVPPELVAQRHATYPGETPQQFTTWHTEMQRKLGLGIKPNLGLAPAPDNSNTGGYVNGIPTAATARADVANVNKDLGQGYAASQGALAAAKNDPRNQALLKAQQDAELHQQLQQRAQYIIAQATREPSTRPGVWGAAVKIGRQIQPEPMSAIIARIGSMPDNGDLFVAAAQAMAIKTLYDQMVKKTPGLVGNKGNALQEIGKNLDIGARSAGEMAANEGSLGFWKPELGGDPSAVNVGKNVWGFGSMLAAGAAGSAGAGALFGESELAAHGGSFASLNAMMQVQAVNEQMKGKPFGDRLKEMALRVAVTTPAAALIGMTGMGANASLVRKIANILITSPAQMVSLNGLSTMLGPGSDAEKVKAWKDGIPLSVVYGVGFALHGALTAETGGGYSPDTYPGDVQAGPGGVVASKPGGYVGEYVDPVTARAQETRALQEAFNAQNVHVDQGQPAEAGQVAPGGQVGGGGDLQQTPEVAPVNAEAVQQTSPQAIAPTGKPVTVKPARGASVQAAYDVVEMGDLILSNRQDMSANPAHNVAYQEKGDTAARAVQVAHIDSIFDPSQYNTSSSASGYAPAIVDENNMVLGGNTRLLALQRRYARGEDAGYRQHLLGNAEQFGIDPARVEGMKEPVLVRRTSPASFPTEQAKIDFTHNTNIPDTATLTPSERARVDANSIIDDAMLAKLHPHEDGSLDNPENQGFLQAFMGKLAPTERGALLDASGKRLSKDGTARIQAALLYRAYGDAGLVDKTFLEADPIGGRRLVAALLRVAPRLANRPEIGSFIAKVARLYSDIKNKPSARGAQNPVEAAIAQTALNEGEVQKISPDAARLLTAFDKSKSVPAFVAALEGYVSDQPAASQSGMEGTPSLFSGGVDVPPATPPVAAPIPPETPPAASSAAPASETAASGNETPPPVETPVATPTVSPTMLGELKRAELEAFNAVKMEEQDMQDRGTWKPGDPRPKRLTRLDDVQQKAAQGVADALGTPWRGVKPSAPADMVRETPPAYSVGADTTRQNPAEDLTANQEGKSGARFATTDYVRTQGGMEPVTPEEHLTFQGILDKGTQAIDSQVIDPSALASQVVEKPRILNDEEFGALTVQQQRLLNAYDAAYAEWDAALAAKDQPAMDAAKAKLGSLGVRLDDVTKALQLSNSRTGAALGRARMILKEDYTLATLLRRRAVEKGGKLSPVEERAARDLVDRLQKKIEEYKRHIAELEARGARFVISGRRLPPEFDEPGAKIRDDIATIKKEFQPKKPPMPWEKKVVAIIREGFLSSPLIVGKLLGVTLWTLPTEVISRIMASATPGLRIGDSTLGELGGLEGLTLREYLKTVPELFKGTLSKEAWNNAKQTFRTGTNKMNPEGSYGYEFGGHMGRMHGVEKAFMQTGFYNQALHIFLNRLHAAGADANSERVQTLAQDFANTEAQRQILQNNNVATREISKLVNGLYRLAHEHEGIERAGFTTLAMGADISTSIKRVSTNFVGRTMETLFGIPIGELKRRAMNKRIDITRGSEKGIVYPTTEEIDAMGRAYRYGGIGLLAAFIGLTQPMFWKSGGFYGGKGPGNKDTDGKPMRAGTHQFMGMHLLNIATHHPLVNAVQTWATIRRELADQTKDGGIGNAVWDAIDGNLEQLPGMMTVKPPLVDLVYKRPGNAAGKAITGLIPPPVKWAARLGDQGGKPVGFNNFVQPQALSRKPRGFREEVKSALPGLRKQVPMKGAAGGSTIQRGRLGSSNAFKRGRIGQ